MEGETDTDLTRLQARVDQENLLREIRAAVLDMQGQLKERSRLCRDRCAKLLKAHRQIEEEITGGQQELFDAEVLLSPGLRQLVDMPSIE